MINRHLAGAVRGVGKSQGYFGISVLYGSTTFELNDQKVEHPTVTTAWEPTPDELELLNKGAAVRITLLASKWVPSIVQVGEPPDA